MQGFVQVISIIDQGISWDAAVVFGCISLLACPIIWRWSSISASEIKHRLTSSSSRKQFEKGHLVESTWELLKNIFRKFQD